MAATNGNLPILSAQTLEDASTFAFLPQPVGASVSGALGIVGLVLATMGIYGVTRVCATHARSAFSWRSAQPRANDECAAQAVF